VKNEDVPWASVKFGNLGSNYIKVDNKTKIIGALG